MLRKGMFLADRYEILEQIGTGGMSDVYKARCHKLNRNVAIKVLKSEYSEDKTFVSKFRVEAQSVAGLTHSNIVNVYDVGDEDGTYFIVMELVEGITLKKYIQKRGRIPFKEAVSIAIQVANGMDAAHKAHIVHRDIKPQNIIISKEGKVKVTDFGIAKVASTTTINSSSSTMGSVHYISPEQARGGYSDEKSDIYSLGITIFEMLTGTVPFDGDSSVAVAVRHIQDQIPAPSTIVSDIPISIDKIVIKATQKKADARYQSAADLIVDLKKSLAMPNEDFVEMPAIYGTASNNDKGVEPDFLDDDFEDDLEEKELNFFNDFEDEEDKDREAGKETRKDNRKRANKYDEDDYDDIDDEGNDKLDLIMRIIGISIAVIILIITVFVVIKLIGMGKSAGNKTNEPAKSTMENTTKTTADDTGKVAVPNVVGLTMEEAQKKLHDCDLGYKKVIQSSKTVEKDVIISQGTAEGTKVNKNTQIVLTVSSGKEVKNVPVPSVTGKTEEEATQLLKAEGFEVTIDYSYSSTVENGKVINFSPSGNVAEGSTITINVSRGKEITYVTMIDLKGKTESEARQWLDSNGLIANVTYVTSNSSVKYGNVISTGYTAGAVVASGTAVDVVVSHYNETEETKATKEDKDNKEEKVAVPNVKGKAEADAKTEIENAGFKAKVEYQNSETVEKGNVISYSPTSSQSKGATITITVSSGKK